MASRIHRLCLTIHLVTSPRIAPLAIKQGISVTGNYRKCAAVHASVWSNVQWVFLKHSLCAEHHGEMTLIFPSWACGLSGQAVHALRVITADCDCFKKLTLEFGSLVHTWHTEIIAFPNLLFSCSIVSDSATPWTALRQTSLSFTICQSLLRLVSIELMMPSNHLILCHPLLLLPSIFPSIRVFFNESALLNRWPEY